MDRILADLGVPVPLRHAVSGIVPGAASAVQVAALPDAVSGADVLAVAPTGSGKTLLFSVALAHRLAGGHSVPGRPRALVVAPTRELAEQSAEVLAEVGAGAGLRVAAFVGGRPVARDRRATVAPVDVAVGTPGRLAELVRVGVLSPADVLAVVLDEADHLLGPSFADQTAALLDSCGGATLLATTATASPGIEEDLRIRRPGLRVHRVGPPPTADVGGVAAAPADPGAGPAGTAPRTLLLLSTTDPDGAAVALARRCRRALFFVPRRDAVEPLRQAIAEDGIPATGVSGSASPTRRGAAFADLASGTVRVLVTTDLAGRGLDIDAVGHVVHVGPPHSVEDLVHRSGRTGRGGADAGVVAALVRPFEVARLRAQATDAGMTVTHLDLDDPASRTGLDVEVGPEIDQPRPRRRRDPAPAPRTRRPASGRVHRPKRKRRS